MAERKVAAWEATRDFGRKKRKKAEYKSIVFHNKERTVLPFFYRDFAHRFISNAYICHFHFVSLTWAA